MSQLLRFGVSLNKDLLDRFDRLIRKKNYTNRSEAIRDLIRQELVTQQWQEGEEIIGAITLVYNHHKRELINKITEIQHVYQNLIIASQHIHLDHRHCMEIIAIRGTPELTQELSDSLKATRGVAHTTLSMSSTGKDLE